MIIRFAPLAIVFLYAMLQSANADYINGLQARWLLSSNATDSLGISDGVASNVQWVSQNIGGTVKQVAYLGDGGEISVAKTSALNLPATGFTLAGWVMSPDFSSAPAPNAYFTLIESQGVVNQHQAAYNLRYSSQGLCFEFSSQDVYPNPDPGYRGIKWISADATSAADSKLLQSNQWYHIAVTYDGTNFLAYLAVFN